MGRHITNNVASSNDETNISFIFLVLLTEPQLRGLGCGTVTSGVGEWGKFVGFFFLSCFHFTNDVF